MKTKRASSRPKEPRFYVKNEILRWRRLKVQLWIFIRMEFPNKVWSTRLIRLRMSQDVVLKGGAQSLWCKVVFDLQWTLVILLLQILCVFRWSLRLPDNLLISLHRLKEVILMVIHLGLMKVETKIQKVSIIGRRVKINGRLRVNCLKMSLWI